MFNRHKDKADPDYLVNESRRLRTELAVTGAKLEVFCQQLLKEISKGDTGNGNGPRDTGTDSSSTAVDRPA